MMSLLIAQYKEQRTLERKLQQQVTIDHQMYTGDIFVTSFVSLSLSLLRLSINYTLQFVSKFILCALSSPKRFHITFSVSCVLCPWGTFGLFRTLSFHWPHAILFRKQVTLLQSSLIESIRQMSTLS